MKHCNKSLIVALWLLSLCSGYVIGVLVGWPNYDTSLISGNVGKAKKFKKNVAVGDIAAVENKIRTDEQFRNQTISSLTFINSRITEFKCDAEMSLSTVKDLPEYKEMTGSLELYIKKATNAQEISGKALKSLDELVKGKADNDYALFANNSILAYMLLDDGVSLGKSFVEKTDLYLKGKKIQDNSKLALCRDLWMKYCTVEAFLKDNKGMYEYWGGKQYLLDPDTFSASINSTANNEQVAVVFCSAILNNSLLISCGASEKLQIKGNERSLKDISAVTKELRAGLVGANENFIKIACGNAQTVDQLVKYLEVRNMGNLRALNREQLKVIPANGHIELQNIYLKVGWGNLFNSTSLGTNLQIKLTNSLALNFI
jgi:hypothetical protein